MFDVTMGSFDGAEVCELVGIYVLNILASKYNKKQMGLYWDDRLVVFENTTGKQADAIKKDITKSFHDLGLKITIDTNMKIVNFLDVTLDLNTGKHYPFRKPNDQPVYISKHSNHPPTILKNLPGAICRRLSDLSSDEHIFDQAAPLYQAALKSSGFTDALKYGNSEPGRARRNRARKIIWFNPPYSKNVSTNIGQRFLRLISKHFPKASKLHKIFNKNTVKVSYSCMPNMATIIKSHNNKICNDHVENTQKPCNCRIKEQCPLDGQCQANNIVYQGEVSNESETNTKLYIGLTENPFKLRYANHLQSIRNDQYENSTELSKHIWQLKRKNENYKIKWSIRHRAQAYTNKTKRCQLCLTEKLSIMSSDKSNLLNRRSELISKCRHRNKYLLSNFSKSKN